MRPKEAILFRLMAESIGNSKTTLTTLLRYTVLYISDIISKSRVMPCSRNLLQSAVYFQYFRLTPSTDKMAGQSDVHQAGDHHSDTEHPSGGQEWQDQGEVPHHL